MILLRIPRRAIHGAAPSALLVGLVLLLGLALAGCMDPDVQAKALLSCEAVGGRPFANCCKVICEPPPEPDLAPGCPCRPALRPAGSWICPPEAIDWIVEGAEQIGPRSHLYGRLPAESTTDPGGGR